MATRHSFLVALLAVGFCVGGVQAQEVDSTDHPISRWHLPSTWAEWQPYQTPDTTTQAPVAITPEALRQNEGRPAARWVAVDPLADMYASWSPYNYVLGDPVNLVDPDGAAVSPPDDFFLHRDGTMDVIRTGRPDRFFFDDAANGVYRSLDLSNQGDRLTLGSYFGRNDFYFAHAVSSGRAGVSVAEQSVYFNARVAAGQRAGGAVALDMALTGASMIVEPLDYAMMGIDLVQGDLHPAAAMAALAPGAAYRPLKAAFAALPRGMRPITDVNNVFGRLSRNHGIDRATASERLHQLKQSYGLPGNAQVIFNRTGGVYHPSTGEFMGTLTEGGARRTR